MGGAAGGVGVEWWANMEDKHGDNGEHDSKEDVDEEMEEETHQHARGIGREGGGRLSTQLRAHWSGPESNLNRIKTGRPYTTQKNGASPHQDVSVS